LSFSSVK